MNKIDRKLIVERFFEGKNCVYYINSDALLVDIYIADEDERIETRPDVGIANAFKRKIKNVMADVGVDLKLPGYGPEPYRSSATRVILETARSQPLTLCTDNGPVVSELMDHFFGHERKVHHHGCLCNTHIVTIPKLNSDYLPE